MDDKDDKDKKSGSLVQLMAELEEDRLIERTKQIIQDGEMEPLAILDACREGITIVGERYEREEYYVSQLIMSAEILNSIVAILEPHLTAGLAQASGKVVFGTVKGDIHNIGKDIVIALLKAEGFDIYDMGVDVEPRAFADMLIRTGAVVLGLSGLLPVSYDSMKETVSILEEQGMRDRIKVMIGGGMVDESVCAYTGADSWGDNAARAVSLCKQFAREYQSGE